MPYTLQSRELASECTCEAIARIDEAIRTLEIARRWLLTSNQTLQPRKRADAA